MKLLLTAFEPFGGENINSALETMRQIPENVCGAQIVKCCLPVAFGKSMHSLWNAIRQEHPDAVLCLGQAGGRHALTPERVAINLNDARIQDNDGMQPVDEPILTDGPAAYFSTLPLKSIVSAIRGAGLPAEISNSAGTYVCNQVMYSLMYIISHEFPAARGGFLHLPFLLEQTAGHPGEFGFSRADLKRGVIAAIEAIVSDCS